MERGWNEHNLNTYFRSRLYTTQLYENHLHIFISFNLSGTILGLLGVEFKLVLYHFIKCLFNLANFTQIRIFELVLYYDLYIYPDCFPLKNLTIVTKIILYVAFLKIISHIYLYIVLHRNK